MEEISVEYSPDSRGVTGSRQQTGLTVPAFIVSLAFLVLGMAWVYVSGMVGHGAQVGESVPVIPAMGAIIVLTLLAPILRNIWRKLDLTQADVMMVYIFVCIAVTCASVGVVRLLLPSLTVTQYFASPDNDFQLLDTYIPAWLAPKDPATVRDMFEGSDGEVIPWKHWAVPLASWSFFLLATFISMLGTMTLFRRRWSEKEHLTFPIVELVMSISDQSGKGIVTAFFRNPIMWAGFLIAAAYNVLNIINAWNPAVPALGRAYNLGGLFTERPWSAIAPLSVAWRPENFGLGYLVSTEITLSVWVFYLALRFSNVMAVASGYDIPGFPYDQEQSAGAYLALGIFLVWVAREELVQIAQMAFGSARQMLLDDREEPMSYRWAIISSLGGFLAMILFAQRAGMLAWTAFVYFGLILLFALVYARARAEAGAAMVWLFPFYQHKRMMVYALGSAPFAPHGSVQNLTIFSLFMFMSRGYYQSMMAYQLEASKIASNLKISQRAVSKWMIVAVLLGLVGAYYIHMRGYYAHGANILEGGTTEGGYRTRLARTEFETTGGYLTAHAKPDTTRATAGAVGFIVAMALVVLRSLFLRFPLHPLGYAMVTSYGGPIWGPFFITWLIKTIVMRVGGMKLYRQMIPFFIGIVLGHFFTAGVVWSLLSQVNDMAQRYSVHFG